MGVCEEFIVITHSKDKLQSMYGRLHCKIHCRTETWINIYEIERHLCREIKSNQSAWTNTVDMKRPHLFLCKCKYVIVKNETYTNERISRNNAHFNKNGII
jgi:hypothetical protein